VDPDQSSREAGVKVPTDRPAETPGQGPDPAQGAGGGSVPAPEVPEADTASSSPSTPPASGGTGGEEIMAKLPHSRPRRASPRRKPRSTARGRAGKAASPSKTAQGSRRRSPAKPTPPAGRPSQPKAGAATPPPRPFPASEPAPGLPRLALDGAVEAAKFPLKVGAGLTLKALDAVARSLRGD
jgi:hypothetical protein